MSFVSIEYAVLFCVVFGIYYAIPKLQIPVLIGASLVFYSWGHHPFLLVMLLGVSMAASAATFLILRNLIDRKTVMVVAIGLNLAVLGFFKYKFLFFAPTEGPGEGFFAFLISLPLPIGISFYTFHAISFIGDAYRGLIDSPEAKKSSFFGFMWRGLLYLVFFPQIVAGPIVKAHQFFPQIGRKTISDVPFADAARWVIWGMFFKLFVADNLGQFTVWMDYPNFERVGRLDLVLLMFCYSAQIFADFAGYSAMAIGSAALLGYKLPINFDRPYVASSFSDFWRRWHISLSTFLREYLYIPLGGNRQGEVRTYLNLIITMGLGGLWHGAAWSYLVWGLMHGLVLAVERFAQPAARGITGVMKSVLSRLYVVFVFLVVTTLWLFFKLPEFSEAAHYLNLVLTGPPQLVFEGAQYTAVAVYALPVLLLHLLPAPIRKSNSPVLTGFVYAVMLFLALFDRGQADAFIYFQF
ncbi:MBOAT family O-acyltransferase [Devosia riboflavina]